MDRDHKDEDEIAKDSPMYVPKGIYFQHDSRTGDQGTENEEERSVCITRCEWSVMYVCILVFSPKTQSRSESVGKWEHDLYIEEEQKPRTQQEKELVSGVEEGVCDEDQQLSSVLVSGSQAFGRVGVSLALAFLF